MPHWLPRSAPDGSKRAPNSAEYQPKLTDLLLAVPLGLVGALAGAIFIVSIAWLLKITAPLRGHLIMRGLIGGRILGVAGALLPLILFSGEEWTAVLIHRAAEIGVVTLIALALVKRLITSTLLITGWKAAMSSRRCSRA
jgi:H+/Cl- antiporter ClcA